MLPVFVFSQNKVHLKDLMFVDDIWYLKSNMLPFTGIFYDGNPYGDGYYSESSLVNGIFNGESNVWVDGDLKDKETYLNGNRIKKSTYESDNFSGTTIYYDKTGKYKEKVLEIISPYYLIQYDYKEYKMINKECFKKPNDQLIKINCSEIP
jgi:hypothetical protein